MFQSHEKNQITSTVTARAEKEITSVKYRALKGFLFVGEPAGFVVEVWSGTSLPKTKERVEMKQVFGKVNQDSAMLYID